MKQLYLSWQAIVATIIILAIGWYFGISGTRHLCTGEPMPLGSNADNFDECWRGFPFTFEKNAWGVHHKIIWWKLILNLVLVYSVCLWGWKKYKKRKN